jgi:hypothetical protein
MTVSPPADEEREIYRRTVLWAGLPHLAGTLKVTDSGELHHINSKRGHYKSGPEQLRQEMEQVERMGIPLNSF